MRKCSVANLCRAAPGRPPVRAPSKPSAGQAKRRDRDRSRNRPKGGYREEPGRREADRPTGHYTPLMYNGRLTPKKLSGNLAVPDERRSFSASSDPGTPKPESSLTWWQSFTNT